MSRNTEVGRIFMESIAANDRKVMGECLSADTMLWYNYAGEVARGREAVADLAASHRGALREMQYLHVRRWDTGVGYVQQSTIRGVTKSGTVFEVPVCLVCTVDADGKIDGLWEYLDPSHIRALMTELGH